MKRKKANVFKNVALICALTLIALLPLPIAEAASFTVSKTNVTLDAGESTTITISASTHTGRIDIISSNPSVAEVKEKSLWVENNSKTITISAKSAGTAKITIKGELFDAATDEEREYSQTVNVTVKAANSNSNNTGGNASGGTNGSTNTGNNGATTGGNSGSISQGTGGTTNGNTGGTQSGSNSNQGSNSGTVKPNQNLNAGGQSSNSSSTSSSSKPSSSSSNSAITNSSQNNTTVIDKEIDTVVEENAETSDEIENTNLTEELSQEEAEIEENLNVETLKNAELSNAEGANSTGKIILIGIIGAISIVMIFIGIGVSKNILKK